MDSPTFARKCQLSVRHLNELLHVPISPANRRLQFAPSSWLDEVKRVTD